MVAFSAAAAAHNAGEPEKSEMTNSAKRQNAKNCSAAVLSSRCQLLGVTRRVPWHRRGPEEDGAAPVTKHSTGDGDDNAGKEA